jgi:predicted AAA+ superfamily ATPase
LQRGGFPNIVLTFDEYKKQEGLQEYYTTIFYRDLVERHNIQDKYTLELLMKYCTDMYTFLVPPAKFMEYIKTFGIDISKPTVLKYLSYLKEGFFIIECPKF